MVWWNRYGRILTTNKLYPDEYYKNRCVRNPSPPTASLQTSGPTHSKCEYVQMTTQKNTRRSPNVALMLGQRRRRWASIETTSGYCILFAGESSAKWTRTSFKRIPHICFEHLFQAKRPLCVGAWSTVCAVINRFKICTHGPILFIKQARYVHVFWHF